MRAPSGRVGLSHSACWRRGSPEGTWLSLAQRLERRRTNGAAEAKTYKIRDSPVVTQPSTALLPKSRPHRIHSMTISACGLRADTGLQCHRSRESTTEPQPSRMQSTRQRICGSAHAVVMNLILARHLRRPQEFLIATLLFPVLVVLARVREELLLQALPCV